MTKVKAKKEIPVEEILLTDECKNRLASKFAELKATVERGPDNGKKFVDGLRSIYNRYSEFSPLGMERFVNNFLDIIHKKQNIMIVPFKQRELVKQIMIGVLLDARQDILKKEITAKAEADRPKTHPEEKV